MYCVKCGTKLPDDAAFCPTCGAPQRAGAPTAASTEPMWETMEIESEHSDKLMATYTFVARVYSPRGSYEYWRQDFGGSRYHPVETVMGPHRDTAQQMLTMIDKEIIKDGWERLPKGLHWYSNRYRRWINPEDLNDYCLQLEIVRQGSFRQTVRWVARSIVGLKLVAASPEFTMGKRLQAKDADAFKALDDLNAQLRAEGGGTFTRDGLEGMTPSFPPRV